MCYFVTGSNHLIMHCSNTLFYESPSIKVLHIIFFLNNAGQRVPNKKQETVKKKFYRTPLLQEGAELEEDCGEAVTGDVYNF